MEVSAVDVRRVRGLVRELEGADCAEELWGRALGGVMALVPADAGQRYRLSPDGDEVFALSRPADSFHADPRVIYDHPLDHPLTGLMLGAAGPGAWRVSDVAGDREWERTHCYNLDFRPFGLRRHLVATAGRDTTAVEGYALVRAGGDFSERDRDLLSFVQLHLDLVERRFAERERLLALTAAALELAGIQGHGVAALDGAGRPQPLNAVAADLLAVVGDDPRLAAGVSFTARQVDVRYVPAVGPERPALLVLRDLARARAVAHRLGVTEQEHRTLRHLDRGRTATEAARRMGLSPATVRGYIASLHRKLDAGHTAALLRRGRDLGLLTD